MFIHIRTHVRFISDITIYQYVIDSTLQWGKEWKAKKKGPGAAAGPFRLILRAYSIFLRCWPIMKVSKLYSEIWNQRYCSARNAIMASCTFLNAALVPLISV